MTLLQALKFKKKQRHKESNIHRINHNDIMEVRKNLPDVTVCYANRRYSCTMVAEKNNRAALIPKYEIGSPHTHVVPLLGKVFFETWETVTRAYKYGISITVE